MVKQRQSTTSAQIDLLEKKYQEETKVLKNEITRLTRQLEAQFERNASLERQHKQDRSELQQLEQLNQVLAQERDRLEQKEKESLIHQQNDEYEQLTNHLTLNQENEALKREVAELEQLLEEIYREKEAEQESEEENDSFINDEEEQQLQPQQ